RSHQRKVEVESVARLDVGCFLNGVDLVHLKRGEHSRLVFCQIQSLAGREGVRPIARSHVVARTGRELSSRSEKPIDRADRKTVLIPTQNEWLVIGVGQTTATPGGSC